MANETATRAQLLQARELIKQRRYDEARVLLWTIDDIKALEWLDRLDQIAPAAPVKPAPPSSKASALPLQAVASRDDLTPRSTSAAGKATSQASDHVVDQLKTAEALVRAGKYRQARESVQNLNHPGAKRLLTAIDEIQAEKRRRSLRRILILSIVGVIVALLAFVGVVGSTLLNQEHVYEDELIRLRYKFPWVEIEDVPNCPEDICKLILQHTFLRNNGMAIGWWDTGESFTNNDLHNTVYDYYQTIPEIDATTIRTYDWEFKGGPAVLVNYYSYHPLRYYHTELWFSEGSVIFFIDRVAKDEDDYAYIQVQFDPILESIEFK